MAFNAAPEKQPISTFIPPLDAKEYAQPIVHALANTLKITSYALCFCGAGKRYGDCCEIADPASLVATEKFFDEAVQYREARGGRVDFVPGGIFKKWRRYSGERLSCLFPGCGERPVSCHLIPENALRNAFGNHCLEYRLKDGAIYCDFIRTGIGVAGTAPAFCSKHDSELFREIDTLGEAISAKQQFLLFLRASSFSLRKTQILLGIDAQSAIFSPLLINQKGSLKPGGHQTLDVSHLSEQYQRFTLSHSAVGGYFDSLAKQSSGDMISMRRVLRSSSNLFCAGYINPAHDLSNRRLNSGPEPIQMTLNLFPRPEGLNIVLTCHDDASKAAYRGLFAQLGRVDDRTFITVINNLLTMHPDNILLHADCSLGENYLSKIKFMGERARLALLTAGNVFSDLINPSQSIRFIV